MTTRIQRPAMREADLTPAPAIADYGLIGDTRSAALVSRGGSIDWLCWPRFDAPAMFCALLDARRGGRCAVVGRVGTTLEPVSRRYLPGTLVLETTLSQRDADDRELGRLTVTDFMSVRQKPCHDTDAPQSPEDDVDLVADGRLVRIVRCDAGAVDVRIDLWPTFDFARARPASVLRDGRRASLRSADDGPGFTVDAGGSLDVDPRRGAVSLSLRLDAGERGWVALTEGAIGRLPGVADDAGLDALLDETRGYWERWTARGTYDGPHRDAVERSLLTLKAMTHSPTGAIVAAPTLGLPEAIGGPRNYDYRFSWLRDGGFTIRALLACGHRREARAFLRFLMRADVDDGRRLPVLFTLDGALPGEEEVSLDHLSGYRDSRPVLVGNAAAGQRQHDVFGEVLNAVHNYYDMTGELPPDGDGEDGHARLARFVANVADCAAEAWRRPDHGIWEPRDGEQHFVHSKAMCWVALDRAAKLAGPLGMAGREAGWRRLADEVRADYHARGWSDAAGAFAQAYDSDALDAAVLRGGLFGAFDPADPRYRATIDAVRTGLAPDGAPDLLYRYRVDDGLPGDEGAFATCSFWLVTCLHLIGRPDEAEAMYGRLLARGNDLGLFAEELDPRTGEMLGNFPQAFTHMGVIHCAVRRHAER